MAVDDLYVPDGVYLKCDQGAIITNLQVNPKKHNLYGLVIATEKDNIPLTNIPSFGACSSSGSACVPKAPEWKKVHEGGTKIEKQNPLLETSFCKCMQGGSIDIFKTEKEALAVLEADKKSRVDKIPWLDSALGEAVMGPTSSIYKLTGGDPSNIGRGIRKGLKGTWNFISDDMWKSETWKGLGKTIMTGVVGYMPPITSEFPSAYEIEMQRQWMNTTAEERIASFDKSMGTDLTSTHEGLKKAGTEFWERKIEHGTQAEGEVLAGEALEFGVELVFGSKGTGAVVKGVKGSAAFASASEKLSKAITTMNEFVKASKLGKLAKSIKGVFKVGRKIYIGLAKIEAYKYAQELLDTLSNNKMPRAVSVIVDKKTGKVYKGTSKGIDDVAQLDKKVVDKLPKPSKEKWPAENCAEVEAYNKAIKDGVNPKDMEMHTVSIDKKSRTYKDFERCENCKVTTKDVGSVTSD